MDWGNNILILYGRRRVGKTALATEFIKGRQAIYFLATEENETQNRLAFKNIVAGRRTGQIKLKQIPFRHYHEFFPYKSEKELIEYYAITGGVPKYIELFYDSADIYTAIENNILSKSSFLYDEPNFLLQREVSEVGSYFSVIKTIASGNQKLSKIASTLELKIKTIFSNRLNFIFVIPVKSISIPPLIFLIFL